MGTKRDLVPFLVEALSSVLPAEGAVLDLMSGSGAASGGFCSVWPTHASDAQTFSRILAQVQGGGYDSSRSKACLGRILDLAWSNESELRRPIEDLLKREAEICHSDLTDDALIQLCRYVEDIPSISTAKGYGGWNPSSEIVTRRSDIRKFPFCLFTAYFPTVYFGLRQSVEIDSLRFAIEQLENEQDRQWALGALMVAVSVRATTFAAHFAQPRFRDFESLSIGHLGKLLDSWAGSIYHEFSVRFNSLAGRSESIMHPVNTIRGPWEEALKEFASRVEDKPAAVYVDAPYTRAEYARYYHVLETLALYDYPSSVGQGRIRSKAGGESFASEFFTRKQDVMEENLVRIIQEILRKGWICAWSYSDAASARISAVIENIAAQTNCTIESHAAPHRYVAQRGKKPKAVTEYLILFCPKK